MMTKNNDLVSGLLGYQFKLKMMVSQRSKEEPKTSEILPVSLPVSILETKDIKEDRGIMDITVVLEKTIIHKHKIPVQH